MTLLKLDKLGYRQGRHIAMSKDWIAYALPRGMLGQSYLEIWILLLIL
jgi:hypothetical protein